MKSLINKITGRSHVSAILLSAVMTTLIAPVSAAANDGSWSLNSSTSSARLFLGSANNPDSVNVGVARVTGAVNLDPDHLSDSVFDLSMYPADEDWGKAVSREGKLPKGYVPDTSDHTPQIDKVQSQEDDWAYSNEQSARLAGSTSGVRRACFLANSHLPLTSLLRELATQPVSRRPSWHQCLRRLMATVSSSTGTLAPQLHQ